MTPIPQQTPPIGMAAPRPAVHPPLPPAGLANTAVSMMNNKMKQRQQQAIAPNPMKGMGHATPNVAQATPPNMMMG